MITELTPEQEALIPIYREKWRAIALSTERIDRQKVIQVIQAAYRVRKCDEPKIIFFDSPYAALSSGRFSWQVECDLEVYLLYGQSDHQNWNLSWELEQAVQQHLYKDSSDNYYWLLDEQPWYIIWKFIASQPGFPKRLISDLFHDERMCFEKWASGGCLYDFYISELGCVPYDLAAWEIFKVLMRECGWVYPFRRICFVCDRPTKLAFDDQGRLHADKEPAIEFADGFCVYAHHGELVTEPDGI